MARNTKSVSKSSVKSDPQKLKEKKLSDITAGVKTEINEEQMFMMNFHMEARSISIGELVLKYQNNEIDFSVDMQRGEMWNKASASLYIHSLLSDLSSFQSPFMINRRDNPDDTQTDEILDGKQRGLPTIIRYVNNEYALCGLANEPYINYRGKPCQINGLRFCQLPEGLREKLRSISIPIALSHNATQKQKSFIFTRINHYKPMSKFDLARAKKEDMSDILAVADHELFTVMCGRDIKKLNHHKIVVESWIVENEEKPIITSGHIDVLMAELSMSETEQNRLINDYNIILGAYKILLSEDKKDVINLIFNKTNFLSYLPYVERFASPKACAEWFVEFYSDIPTDYTETIEKGHTNNTTNVQKRMDIIENSINDFLQSYEGQPDEQEENAQMML